MMTLRRFSEPTKTIPGATSWYLADLGEARGKQELFTKQSPQKLKALREHALIESAVASNRIEGVEVEPARVGTIVFGKALLRDRDEEEVRGYRKALDLIHSKGKALPISEETIRRLHSVSRGGIGVPSKFYVLHARCNSPSTSSRRNTGLLIRSEASSTLTSHCSRRYFKSSRMTRRSSFRWSIDRGMVARG